MRDEAAWTPAEATRPFLARGLAKNTGLEFDVVRPLLTAADPLVPLALAARPDLLPDAAGTLATHPDALVRTKLASSAGARHAFARLAEDEDVGVRRALATNEGGYRRDSAGSRPGPAVRELAHDPDVEVRRGVAAWAPREAVLHLVADPSPLVRAAVATDPLPEPAIRALLTDVAPEVRESALSGGTVPPDLVVALVTDPDASTRAAAAAKLPLTEDLAAGLAADPDPWVREHVVRNPDLPLPLLLRLADDPDEDVRAAVMVHPDLPTDVRARVEATVALEWHHVAHWLTHAPLAQRLEHVDSPFVFFRRALAFTSDLPVDAVRRLAADTDHSVRLLLAEHHPDAPGELIADLIPCGHATWELIKHPNLTVEALTSFAESDDEYARLPAATNPRLPPAVIVRLLDSTHHNTRVTAAANPALPEPVLRRLLSDGDSALVTAAASNPAIPPALARRLVEAIRA